MPCDVVDCTDFPEVYADVVDFDDAMVLEHDFVDKGGLGYRQVQRGFKLCHGGWGECLTNSTSCTTTHSSTYVTENGKLSKPLHHTVCFVEFCYLIIYLCLRVFRSIQKTMSVSLNTTNTDK